MLFVLLKLALISFSYAGTNDSLHGLYQISEAEYRFPAAIDQDVLPGVKTEIWGKMFYPTTITKISSAIPLVIMLHGNHSTCGKGAHPRIDSSCSYTETGTCPVGYIPVPNHAGYDYIAKNLASWGMLVVSINANRGITCGAGTEEDAGLNLARGRLILRHLDLLHEWSTNGSAPASLGLGQTGLINKIDFTSVGLMGHSRGGEGVRAAYNLYHDANSIWQNKIPNLKIKAIFEIGAVDGQTTRKLDANGTAWNQLLPLCDGDVSTLEGRYPFERMLKNQQEESALNKSLYEVWGANHNFFNTEWQESDSTSCDIGKPLFDASMSGSEQQQIIATASMSAFFRQHLLNEPSPTEKGHFNPLATLPTLISSITQVDRDFTISPGNIETLKIEEFDQETGMNTSGNQNRMSNIYIKHMFIDKTVSQRGAIISWQNASDHTFFDIVLSKNNSGVNLLPYATLDFRLARTHSKININETTDFSIMLEDSSGRFSKPVYVSNYLYLNEPGTHIKLLKAMRIPLSDFKGAALDRIQAIRLVFNKTEQGELYLGNIRAHKHTGLEFEMTKTHPTSTTNAIFKSQIGNRPLATVPTPLNKITKVIRLCHQCRSLSNQAVVEISLASSVPFPVMNRLPELIIGDKTFTLSRYSDMETLKELTFTIPTTTFDKLDHHSSVRIKNGRIWEFGFLEKSEINQYAGK